MNFSFNPSQENKDPIKEFGRNLTQQAAQNKLDPIIGRDEEIRRVIRILSRKTKNNPVLVGEPGVGKTAIAEGLAQKIIAGDVPENLKGKEIIELDIAALIAGASFQGQFEKRLKNIMKAIKDSGGNLIIFVDEVHTLIGAGKIAQGGMDAAQIIKPMLAKGEMRMIGATTLDEHKKYIESDPAFERRLQMVLIKEPSQKSSLAILRGIKERFENYHKVYITDNALIAAVKLSSRYISDRYLPDKAIDLIDEAAAGIQTQMNSKPEELEKKENQLALLEMEKAAIKKDKENHKKVQLNELEEQIKIMKNDVQKLSNAWENEKNFVEKIVQIKEKIEYSKIQQQRLQSEGEYEKASILLYKEIPSLEKQLKKFEERAQKSISTLLKDKVTENEIADVVSKWTGVPISKLLQEEQIKLLSLEKHLSLRIKGQNNVLELVANAILRSRANINDPNRPIGSFVFIGPTGVGKTEVAKALAFELFDTEKALVRIDMSEFQEEHTIARLIGSPPGYVGFDQGGQLTESVRRRPYSIILFDEIEKAHPKILDILLQILDDGHITDAKGKEINFKNTIIILTTNIGSTHILEEEKERATELLQKSLKPELLNRIDEIVAFNSLDNKAIYLITQNELEKLNKRLYDQNIKINFEPEVIKFIAQEAYDPAYGARPVKRYIQKNIESVLAKKIINQSIEKNTIYVSYLDKNKKIQYRQMVIT